MPDHDHVKQNNRQTEEAPEGAFRSTCGRVGVPGQAALLAAVFRTRA